MERFEVSDLTVEECREALFQIYLAIGCDPDGAMTEQQFTAPLKYPKFTDLVVQEVRRYVKENDEEFEQMDATIWELRGDLHR